MSNGRRIDRVIRTAMMIATVAIGAPAAARDDGHEHSPHHRHGAHEHGIAEVTIAVDGAVVEIEFESPAMNLLGFEHRPRTDAQRESLEAAIAALRRGDGLVAFEPAGVRCVQRRAVVLSSLLDEAEDEDQPREGGLAGSHADHDVRDHEHADVFVAWRFECDGAAVAGIDLRGIFGRFPATGRLRVQAVTGQGQTARELTAASSRLRWSP